MPNFGKKSTNSEKQTGNKTLRKAVKMGNSRPLKKDPGVFQLKNKDKKSIESSFSNRLKVQQEKKQRQMNQLIARTPANLNSSHEDDEDTQNNNTNNLGGRDLSDFRPVAEGSKRAFFKDFKKVVEGADVILEVLDARDPLGCRCIEMEKKILGSYPDKRIILILNKIDLIPRENMGSWLKYLRNEFPTIAFKASTQQQKKNLAQNALSADIAPDSVLQSNEALGADTLLQLLKNYSRSLNLKTAITVGIIGYPNVGKSSLINSLKRSKAVSTGATPGVTKTIQKVSLDKHVHLLDCPGIVFGEMSDTDVILRNCIKVEQVEDPITPVSVILQRVPSAQLCQLYGIPEFANVTQFLVQLADRRRKVVSGGIYDLEAVAKIVLNDWNSGKISFFTVPPVSSKVIQSEVVSSWGPSFNINNFVTNKDEQMIEMDEGGEEMGQAHNPTTITPTNSSGIVVEFGGVVDIMQEEEFGTSSTGNSNSVQHLPSGTIVGFIPEHQQKGKFQSLRPVDLATAEDEFNPQHGKQLKKQLKKLKKKQKKLEIFPQEGAEDEDDDEWQGSAEEISEGGAPLNTIEVAQLSHYNKFKLLGSAQDEEKPEGATVLSQPKFNFAPSVFNFTPASNSFVPETVQQKPSSANLGLSFSAPAPAFSSSKTSSPFVTAPPVPKSSAVPLDSFGSSNPSSEVRKKINDIFGNPDSKQGAAVNVFANDEPGDDDNWEINVEDI